MEYLWNTISVVSFKKFWLPSFTRFFHPRLLFNLSFNYPCIIIQNFSTMVVSRSFSTILTRHSGNLGSAINYRCPKLGLRDTEVTDSISTKKP